MPNAAAKEQICIKVEREIVDHENMRGGRYPHSYRAGNVGTCIRLAPGQVLSKGLWKLLGLPGFLPCLRCSSLLLQCVVIESASRPSPDEHPAVSRDCRAQAAWEELPHGPQVWSSSPTSAVAGLGWARPPPISVSSLASVAAGLRWGLTPPISASSLTSAAAGLLWGLSASSLSVCVASSWPCGSSVLKSSFGS